MVRLESPPPLSRYGPPLAFLLAVAGLYFAKAVLIPLSLAALLAFLLTPAVRRLEAWRLPRTAAVLLVLLFSFSAFAILGWIAANQLIDVLNELPKYQANIHGKIEALRPPGKGGLAKATETVKELSKELSTTAPEQVVAPVPRQPKKTQKAAPPSPERPLLVQLVDPPSTVLQSLSAIISPLLAPIATAGIVSVFAIVMLLKREDLRNRFLRLIGQTQLNLATEAIDDATQRVSRYLRLQFVVNAAFGTLVTSGLYFIGVPNALLWGVLAGVLRFVPFVGAIIGASLPLILALAIFDSWQRPVMVLGLFLVVEPTVAYVVEPWLYGTHTGISSLAILVSAAFWTTLWGPIGLILSTPLTVCLVVIGRHVPHLGFLHVVLGDEEVLSAAAQFYQRLLALDQHEAKAVIDAFLKEHPLIQLYDDVMIPALSMAEEDRHKGALDETRERFLLQSIEEFVAELAEVGAGQPSNTEQSAVAESTNALITPHQEIRVVCIPASDKADEISGAMLTQVLDLAGFTTASFSAQRSPADVLETLCPYQGDIVCISAVPPFALMNARSFSKQLRARFPQLRIVVGLWSFSGNDGVRVDERLGKAFTVEVVTTLAQALESIRPSPDSTPPLAAPA